MTYNEKKSLYESIMKSISEALGQRTDGYRLFEN
jgi:hypothetical protein